MAHSQLAQVGTHTRRDFPCHQKLLLTWVARLGCRFAARPLAAPSSSRVLRALPAAW